MELKAKNVVVTGGTKGLGLALVQAFSDEGAQVAVAARTPAAGSGSPRKFIKCDVSEEAQVRRAADEAEGMLGSIDIWVNNAGVWLPPTPLEEISLERVRSMVGINLLGLIYGTQEAVARIEPGGAIINILSTSALEGRGGQSVYCATKFGAAGFTKAVREEVRGKLLVLSVYPGGMQTHFFDEAKPSTYGTYMRPESVAASILENLKLEHPVEELILKRPAA